MAEENKSKKVQLRHMGGSLTVDKWLSIANLFLTAIVGIGIALYLQTRNEELQKQVVTLQTDLERRTEFANLKLACTSIDCTSSNGVEITNSGLAPAKNVRLTINIGWVYADWKNSVIDINQFDIVPRNLSLSLNIEDERLPIGNQDISGDNTKVITFEYLPPNSKTIIVLQPANSLPMYGAYNDQTFSLVIPSEYGSNWEQYDLASIVGNKVSYLLQIANFHASISCANCEGDISELDFSYSTLENFAIKSIENAGPFVDKNPWFSTSGTLLKIDIRTTCRVPASSGMSCTEFGDWLAILEKDINGNLGIHTYGL